MAPARILLTLALGCLLAGCIQPSDPGQPNDDPDDAAPETSTEQVAWTATGSTGASGDAEWWLDAPAYQRAACPDGHTVGTTRHGKAAGNGLVRFPTAGCSIEGTIDVEGLYMLHIVMRFPGGPDDAERAAFEVSLNGMQRGSASGTTSLAGGAATGAFGLRLSPGDTLRVTATHEGPGAAYLDGLRLQAMPE